jgi:hypothetical protein
MSVPPIPPPLEHLATRSFSFYPAIVNIEHNEWLFRKATWSEILVRNCKTQDELWISRRYVGEVSRIDDPVLIVGLVKELEYKAGAVWPYQRRVIQMPVAVGGGLPPPALDSRSEPAAVVGMGRQPKTDSRIVKLIGGVIVVGILACLLVLNFYRVGDLRARVTFTTKDQSYLELGSRDDFFMVTQKIGRPTQDRFQSETGAIQFQAMSYPDRGYTVILMGSDRKSMHYIGTLDRNWTPVHSVNLRTGGSTFAMLRGLQKF